MIDKYQKPVTLKKKGKNVEQKIGFGLIGLGSVAKTHAFALQKAQESFLAGAYSSNKEKVEAFCKQYGGKPYTDLAEFLKDENIQVVDIATPSGLHMETAIEALKAKKHVLVEKPLEISLERCQTILEEAKRQNRLVGGIFQSRFYDAPQLIKKALDEGRFGKLALVEASVKWFRSQEYYDSGAWRGTWDLDGGGALMNQSIHAIDLLSWFGGEVEELSAFTQTRAHERIEVEDNGVAILKFKNGALGIINGSTSIYPGFTKRIEICGTEGSAILEDETLVAWSFKAERPEDEEIRRKYSNANTAEGGAANPSAINYVGHMRQFDDFAKAVKTGSEPFITGQEASKAVGIIKGIYESAKEGRTITLSAKGENL